MNPLPVVDRLRAWLPLLPVLGLLLGSYWLNTQVQPVASATGNPRHDVDFVVGGVRSATLDAEGQPRFLLRAEKMWHYPDDDTTHLQNPSLTSFVKDQPPAQFDAQSGMINSQGDEINLRGDVRIVRTVAAPASAQHFNTEYLRVLPDKGWAETDFPVQMFDRYNTLTAVGMQLDNEARSVRFLQQVRAVHEKTD